MVAEGNLHTQATSRLILKALLAVAALLIGVSAVSFQAPEMLGREKTMTDFDAFYVAGTLALNGRAADAYSIETMLVSQQQITGTKSFMPWTYPPPFTLLVGGLALMPVGIAYLLFTSLSFIFYLLILRRIAGEYLPGVLVAIMPTVLLTLRTGQNGFLTGGLIGIFLLTFLNRRPAAGIPLGLMIIKPHLAAAIAVLTVVEKRWSIIAVAGGVVTAALLISTAVFGVAIWSAFMGGVRESGLFLAEGYYPLFRMTSLYAMGRSTGLSANLALALQGCGALLTIGLFLYLRQRNLPPRMLAATACVASLFISPYNYDYDLAILGVAIAFVLPDIIKMARPAEKLMLLALCWFVTGYGLAVNMALEAMAHGSKEKQFMLGEASETLSLTAPALVLLVGAAALLLTRTKVPIADEAEAVSNEQIIGILRA